MNSLANAHSYDRLVIASANLLIETNTARDRHLRVPPQHERTDEQIKSFLEIERKVGRPIDALGLQELQINNDFHNGETIRNALSMPFGAYRTHSRKAVGEHIAAIGINPDSHEFVRLGKNRYAPVLRIGELAVMFVHMSYTDTDRRKIEYDTLMEFADEEENLIVSGDFNEEPHIFSSRRQLGKVGLHSAFTQIHYGHPITLPAPGYGQLRPFHRRIGYGLMGGGLQYDDIYIKGELRVRQAGTVNSASDHRFPYAEIVGPSGMFEPRDP